MPPWNHATIVGNLQTLAGLKANEKLKDCSKDRLKTSWSKWGGGRAIRGESLTNDAQYLVPLSALFTRAVEAVSVVPGVTLSLIDRALAGLRANLRANYETHADLAHRQKVAQIMDACRDAKQTATHDVAGHGAASIDVGVAGMHVIDFLNDGRFATSKSMLMSALDMEGNADLCNEPLDQVDSVAQEVIEQFVFSGKSKQESKLLPTTNDFYKRQKVGVCTAYYKDTSTTKILLPSNLDISSEQRYDLRGIQLKPLYQLLDEDEAVLFCVSQLCNQGGLEGLPANLLSFATVASRTLKAHVPLMMAGGRRLMPINMTGASINYISKAGARLYDVVCKSEIDVSGHAMLRDPVTRFMDLGGSLVDEAGLITIKCTFAVRLTSSAHIVDLDVTKAKIRVDSGGIG